MMDYDRFIKTLGKCYHLHIDCSTSFPEQTHRKFSTAFKKAMQLRPIRRVRPTYLRLVNIENNSSESNRCAYRYVSDIVSPSLSLLSELCPCGAVDIDAPKLSEYQILRCFDYPIKLDRVDHITKRLITPMHPMVVLSNLLAAHPKSILSFRFGLSHTLYLSSSIDYEDHFKRDKMDFTYKRITHYQPITFNHKDL